MNMFSIRTLVIGMMMVVVSACSPAPVAVADASVAPVVESRTESAAKNNVINFACQTAADCAVKDVGSCCGYTPSCVNIDSPTFPEQVAADCEREGTSGICGFRDVARCECVEARCTSVYAGDAGLPIN
jgi:hypothetical protein